MKATLATVVEWCAPQYFPKASRHQAGEAFSKLPAAVTAERMKERQDNANHFRHTSGNSTSVVRVEPHGAPRDTFEQLDWVPESLKKAGIGPEKLSSFGAPWLMGLEPAASRVAPEQYLFPGAGHCLHQIEGEALVICWPLGPAIEKGASAATEQSYFGEMDTKAFAAFAEAHFKHVIVKSGDTVWVPWGWHVAMVNKSDARVFNALYVPWFNATLLKDMDVVVIRSALASLATWATETTLKAIVGQRDAIQEWLETNNPNGEPVMAIVRTPALQDKDNEEEGGDGDDDEEEDEEEDGAADECEKAAEADADTVPEETLG